jgi:ABC-type branched-subunit amino acid transport system ATPase component
MTSLALEVQSVGHGFGGLTVLSNVTFAVPDGQIVGLIGPNGSGKSTLFNIVNGFLHPRSGRVLLFGKDTHGLDVEARSRAGLLRTFQTPKVFEHMSVLENLMAGAHKLARLGVIRSLLATPGERAELGVIRAQAEATCRRFGLEPLRNTLAGKLTSGQRRMVELARAYAGRPRVLLLDEPSSGLNDDEVKTLGNWLKTLRGEGIALLLVSHDMQLMGVADVVNVLYFGEIIAAGTMSEMQRDARVREVYLGA